MSDQKILDLRPGETVHITIEDARLAFSDRFNHTFFVARSGEDRDHYLALPHDVAGVTISRRAPVDGEPQPGDVWRDATGTLYFARIIHFRDGPRVAFVTAKGGEQFAEWRTVHAGPSGPIALDWRPEVVEAEVVEDWPEDLGESIVADAEARAAVAEMEQA